MKNLLPTLLIAALLMSSCEKDDITPTDNIEIPEGYSLVWSDEFNSSEIDLASWVYDTGDGTAYGLPPGWGNNEKQIYTSNPENSGIVSENDVSSLEINALEDNSGSYTSARITTKEKVSLRFGRIDVRAKMPEGRGLWPAIWMLGDNIDEISWPGCGEIDIAEVLGHQTSHLKTTIHYTAEGNEYNYQGSEFELQGGTFNEDFHIFSLEWTPDNLIFILDGQDVHSISIEQDMKEFLRSFYLILNVAVGGNLSGDPDETTVFPQTMNIDYVRVFSKDGLVIPDSPPLVIDEETVGQVIAPNIGTNAIQDGFTELGDLTVITYGPGEPLISSSEIAVNGDSSLVFDFPGGTWGGGYLQLDNFKDMTNYSILKFSVKLPADLVNAEIKLESPATNAAVFLIDYTGVSVSNGFVEYSIPLSDFTGLDLSDIKIPFAMWNPMDASSQFVSGGVLIDNIYFIN